MLDYPFQVFGLKVGYADMSHHSLVAQRDERGERFVDDLVEVGELDVVYVDKVDVVNVQPFHAFVHAVGYALGRIVPGVDAVLAVTPYLRGQVVLVPRYFLEGFPEHCLGLVVAVVGRYVDEVYAVVDGSVHGTYAFRLAYVVEYAAERRRSESEVYTRMPVFPNSL
ncbi:unknown [Prevotella sp. CAG:1124]|nr:unknown [Prevotella sp. CAG:1124]